MLGSFKRRVGIIPTRMGTRGDSGTGVKIYEDHPHAYGDKLKSSKVSTHDGGSSPRVWGQVSQSCKIYKSYRIIPTRMGTSLWNYISHSYRQDHPHAYGDKGKIYGDSYKYEGSSPRVWGQVSRRPDSALSSGIIPTRVGTRPLPYYNDRANGDHPHACGDKDYNSALTYPATGSSPRVWGQAEKG